MNHTKIKRKRTQKVAYLVLLNAPLRQESQNRCPQTETWTALRTGKWQIRHNKFSLTAGTKNARYPGIVLQNCLREFLHFTAAFMIPALNQRLAFKSLSEDLCCLNKFCIINNPSTGFEHAQKNTRRLLYVTGSWMTSLTGQDTLLSTSGWDYCVGTR